jgi:hypothetical protein
MQRPTDEPDAPESSPTDGQTEDWEAVSPSTLSRAAALSTLSLGVFSTLLGAQLVYNFKEYTLRSGSMFAIGAVTLVAGWALYRTLKPRTVQAGLALGAATLLLGCWWAVSLLLEGVLSALSLAVLPHALVTSVLCLVAITPAERAELARQRLRSAGFDT